MVIDMLIKRGLDVRFIVQLFDRELSAEFLKIAMKNLDIDWNSLKNLDNQKALESLLYKELLSRRELELESEITPMERRVLHLYRKIRNINLIRWIIKK